MTPRAASERLVEYALDLIGDSRARVADVGTGSGAIAIAVARAAPRVEVWASDLSSPAVALARANLRRHGLGGRVFVRDGDLLEPLPGSFDLVLANLPYLPAASAAAHPELNGEPPDAVYAPGDGLGLYRRLLAQSAGRRRPRGAIAFQLHREVAAAAAA